jgi:serine/threonine protein kinase/tetratricopeptide (TPR) repeat protein
MKEESLFAAALDKPTEADRFAFLDEACAGDAELRRRVEQLLASHERSRGILDREENAASILGAYRPELPLAAEQVVAGRFKLRRKLGEGGMGEVWVADQQEPVRRQVAIKVIQPGRRSEPLLARFNQERQALALMDHANIAKVFDAGVASGRPFFVMEFIQGVPITQFCDDSRLSLRERLKLFLPICHAIQHAHQKGIIHRDLKPSNILVGLYDGKPVPKVIDFGVAKTIGPLLSEQHVSTEVGTLVGTLEYMSPEQADFNNLDIDTRTDIYALGVVLYQLLTGTVPFSYEQMRSTPFAEMLRTIQEVEPPRPSRLRIADCGLRIPERRAWFRFFNRQSAIHNPRSEELDWIVMKCLEKDRNRRYETPNALAMDLERYLVEEPVLAGPPSAGYRLRKFLRRNRGRVLAASLVLVALLGGIVGTTVGLVRAVQARNAEAERAEGERLAREMAEKRLIQIEKGIDLLASVFEDLDPRAEEKEGRPLRVILGDRLVRAAAELEGEAVGEPLMVAGLQDRLGLSLLRLGMAERAIGLFARSRATREAMLGADHRDTLSSMNNLARGYHDAGKLHLALPLLEETLQRRRATLGNSHRDTLISMNNLASAYRDVNQPAKALPLLRETLELRKATLGLRHQETLTSMNNLAVGYWAAGQPEKTMPLHEKTLELRKAVLGPYHVDTLQSMSNLGSSYRYARKLDKALALHEEAVRLCKSRLGADHPHTLLSMSNLAFTYEAAGQAAKAVSLREETLKLRKARLGEGHPDTIQSMYELARGYSTVGKFTLALPLFHQAAAGVEARAFAHRHAGRIIPALYGCHEQLNQYDQAEVWRRKWLAAVKAKDGTGVPEYTMGLMGLASNLLQQKKHADAEAALRECLAILAEKQPEGWETFHAQSLLGTALLRQKKYAEAESQLLQGFRGMKKKSEKVQENKHRGQAARKPLIGVLESLLQLYDDWGKPEAAGKWRQELEEVKRLSGERTKRKE